MLARVKQLSRDTLIYGLGGAAARFSGLALLPIYTRAFSDSAAYGAWQTVNNFGALLFAVTVLGLDGASAIVFFATDSPLERQRISTLWVTISVLASVPVAVLLLLFSDWVSLAASDTTQYAPLFRIGIAALPFTLLQAVISHILRLYFRPRAYAVLNIVFTLLVLGASIYLVVGLGMEVYGALWGTLIGTALACVVGLWTVRDSVQWHLLNRAAWPIALKMLKLGAPLVPASIALWIISFSNTFFLNHLASTAEVGVFRVGAQLGAILGIGVWAFQLAWLPYSLSIAREPDAPQVYSRVATLYTAGAVGVSVVMAGAAPILLLLLAPGYFAAASVIGVLSLAAASLGAYYVSAIGVIIAQRTGQVGWTTIVAACANLALNALLISIWGIVGAAVASLAANLLSTTLVYAVSQRVYPLPYEPVKMLLIWLAGSACVAAAAIFNMALQPSILMSTLFTLLTTTAFIAALFATRTITLKQITALKSILK